MEKQSGFTLLELLTAMTIGAILMAIAVPSFRITILNNRLSTPLNTLLSGMIYTRTEAIKRNVNVVICASSDQQTCTGGAWGSGWIVYYTPAGSATNPVPAPTGTEIIRQFPALSGGNTLNTTASNPAVPSNTIVFQPSGMTLLTGDAQFSLCDTRGTTFARTVMVSITGRAQVVPTTTTTWNGKPLTPSCP